MRGCSPCSYSCRCSPMPHRISFSNPSAGCCSASHRAKPHRFQGFSTAASCLAWRWSACSGRCLPGRSRSFSRPSSSLAASDLRWPLLAFLCLPWSRRLWPLKANIFLLGVANGAFAVAAIGAMMMLASGGDGASEGIRMGVWGAAQAVSFRPRRFSRHGRNRCHPGALTGRYAAVICSCLRARGRTVPGRSGHCASYQDAGAGSGQPGSQTDTKQKRLTGAGPILRSSSGVKIMQSNTHDVATRPSRPKPL
jgi:hypothetical protein